MRKTNRLRAPANIAVLALGTALSPLDSQALITKPGPPGASTGKVNHVRGTSATLNGTVQPQGLTSTYYFQYGPTVAYGSQTTAATLTAGYTRVKVGQAVVGLRFGEHYRIVATNAAGTSFGRDRTYAPKSTGLKFAVPKAKHLVADDLRRHLRARGALTGAGSAFHRITLQASPYPYLEPFAAIGTPVTTSATGAFTLRVAR